MCRISYPLYLQVSGQSLADNDPDVNLFLDYLDGAIFVSPSVNLLMLAMPFLRYFPGVYKQTFDKMVVIKKKMTQRYFITMKVIKKSIIIITLCFTEDLFEQIVFMLTWHPLDSVISTKKSSHHITLPPS